MSDSSDLLRAIVSTAFDWRDPDYPIRLNAVQTALQSENRHTEEALAFGVNRHVSQLEEGTLTTWLSDSSNGGGGRVLVGLGSREPLEGLWDWLAVTLSGHAYMGVYAGEPPVLLQAFAEEVERRADTEPSLFGPHVGDSATWHAVIARSEDKMLARACSRAGARGFMRKRTCPIAILDGTESEETRMNLAEDALLFDGVSRNNTRLVWAPAEQNPDPYLEAFALFRSVFPVHPDTPGTLQMQKAFLASRDMPHAFGEGLEFLVSKGPPEFLEPCHIRWSTYSSPDEVMSWLNQSHQDVSMITTASNVIRTLGLSVPIFDLGVVHRLSLIEHPQSRDVLNFLMSF